MNCKFCNAELESEMIVCPICGKDNAEPAEVQETEEPASCEAVEEAVDCCEMEQPEMPDTSDGQEVETPVGEPPKKRNGLLITAVCGVLAVALLAALWYGTNGGWAPKKGGWVYNLLHNEITSKASYTVSAEEFETKADVVIATAGDKELTNEQLQVFFWSYFYDFLNYYSSYASYLGLDYTAPLDTQVCALSEEGLTWQQYFLDQSLQAWHRYQSLVNKAEASGIELDAQIAEQLAAIPEQLETVAQEGGYASAEEMIQVEMGPGATIDAYMDYLTLYNFSNQFYGTEYETMMPTDAEIEAYFTENEAAYAESGLTKDTKNVDVRHILLTPEGGTTDESGVVTYSEEEWDACRTAAQEILDAWLAGDKTEESFAQLANEHSTDPGSNTNGGLYEGVSQGQMVEAFDAWCFDPVRQPGDNGLVQTNYGYHIMYYVGGETLWYSYVREDMMAERGNTYIDGVMAEYPMEVDYKKIIIGNLSLYEEAAVQTEATTGPVE